jgi:APA family basic amino acid/polyamine antiporter
MARDGLLPSGLAAVSERGVPVRMTLATAIVVAALAGLAPLSEIASLANAGALAAFVAVSVCLLVLRRRYPPPPAEAGEADREAVEGAVGLKLPRRFRAPLAWVIAPVAIAGCLYLFWNLPTKTKLFFAAWNALGLILYFAWRASRAAAQPAEA